ncbi:MAG TPA: hypothetical protein DF409_14840, partial [Bacteroidales bacterium]|nr:hypothetical protein [Bacteroidales bacterium]
MISPELKSGLFPLFNQQINDQNQRKQKKSNIHNGSKWRSARRPQLTQQHKQVEDQHNNQDNSFHAFRVKFLTDKINPFL